MYKALEAFIDYCDEMVIANESSNGVELSQKQIKEVIGSLDKEYSKEFQRIYNSVLSKFNKLKNESAFNIRDWSFRYTRYTKQFYIRPDGFENYGYQHYKRHDGTVDEYIKLTNEYINDLQSLKSELVGALSKYKGFTVQIEEEEEGLSVSEYHKYMIKTIQKRKVCPSNNLVLRIYVDNAIANKLIPSDSEIKERERQRYLKLYEEFLKFLKNPYKLTGNLWSAHISDICQIVGLSSQRLNEIVAKTIRNVGKAITIDGESFADNEYGNHISKKLGECYILDTFDSDRLVYSIKDNKIYWISYEHDMCETFFNNFPYFLHKKLPD